MVLDRTLLGFGVRRRYRNYRWRTLYAKDLSMLIRLNNNHLVGANRYYNKLHVYDAKLMYGPNDQAISRYIVKTITFGTEHEIAIDLHYLSDNNILVVTNFNIYKVFIA